MNTINLFTKYADLLDEVYTQSAKTSVIESDRTLARAGANANELIIPKISMDGLADYDRNSGYTTGNVTLANETVSFNYERGRMFSVDAMDDEETANIAFGKLAGEFVRTKVVPELDAVRFAAYSSASGISAGTGKYTTAAAVLSELANAQTIMDEAEVPYEDRYLFITPKLISLANTADITLSRSVLDDFAGIIKVPQTRFYTKIDLLDGVSAGETDGGFKKASDAKNINFMIIHKAAVMQYTKHAAPKVITPESNQTADAWKFGYRIYGLNDVYENKAAGIYVNTYSA